MHWIWFKQRFTTENTVLFMKLNSLWASMLYIQIVNCLLNKCFGNTIIVVYENENWSLFIVFSPVQFLCSTLKWSSSVSDATRGFRPVDEKLCICCSIVSCLFVFLRKKILILNILSHVRANSICIQYKNCVKIKRILKQHTSASTFLF